MSKDNEQTTDGIINVDLPSVACRTENILTQIAGDQSAILIKSSQEEIPDIPTHSEHENTQSVPWKTSSGNMN